MRAARLFLGFSASFAVIASVASGCGSSSSNPPVDSGTGEDVTMEAAPMMEAAVEATVEAAAPEAAVDAACVPDASLSSIPIPDAGFGDSGIDVMACFACVQTECPSVVAMCNMSCACISAVEMAAKCLGSAGGSLLNCASDLSSAGISITSCPSVLGCAAACGVNLGGGDSGMHDGSVTDAETDGG